MRFAFPSISRKLSRKQAFWAAGLGLVIGAAMAGIQIRTDMAREAVRIETLGNTLLSPLHESLVLIAFRLDESAAINLLGGLLNEPSVASAQLIDDFGDPIAKVSRVTRHTTLQNFGRVFGKEKILTERELAVEGLGPVGRVTIQIDPLVASDSFSKRTAIVLASGLTKSLILSFALSWLFARMTTRRIERLSQQFETKQRPDQEAPDQDEIDGLEALLLRWQWDKDALITSLDEALEKTRLATSAANLAIWEYNTSDGSLIWMPEMYALYGVTTDAFRGNLSDFSERLHEEDRDRILEAFRASLQSGQPLHDTFRIVTPAGQVKHVQTHAIFLCAPGERGMRAIGVNADITSEVNQKNALRAAHEELEIALKKSDFEARHDVLSGLANRRALSDHLQHLAKTLAPDAAVCFLHIDLDRFKSINDVFGHRAGDELLKAIADRLRAVVTEAEFVARVGGDEFAVVLSTPDRVVSAEFFADQIIEACAEPLFFEGALLRTGASVGIADATASTLTNLDTNADIALYEAKRSGRGRHCWFDRALRNAAEDRKIIGDRLADALERDQLHVVLQPQVGAEEGELVGFEALVRWSDTLLGNIAPDRFLPVASEIGLLSQIDSFVLTSTLKLVERLQAAGFKIPKVAVNVSLPRLMDRALLDSLGYDRTWPCPLGFELLETMDFDAFGEDLVDVLDGLRARNIEIEIDDFGSGYASVSALSKIRPKTIKLDRSITNVDSDPDISTPIVNALVSMAHSLGIRVIAEGVESARQAEMLRGLGCDVLQGYYFAEPMNEEALVPWLQSFKPKPRMRVVRS